MFLSQQLQNYLFFCTILLMASLLLLILPYVYLSSHSLTKALTRQHDDGGACAGHGATGSLNSRRNRMGLKYAKDPNPGMSGTRSPKICWLLSYPNSGTSFTMKLVGHASNRTVATNYGLECGFDEKGELVPLYHDSPNGPYLIHPEKGLPENYILTKTHCGGRCNDCGPSTYLETKESFMLMCSNGARVTLLNSTKVNVNYNPKLAQRAIHLVRNPFNNIVSNFHLERHEKFKKKRNEWLEKYSNDAEGFRLWCHDIDAKYEKEEMASRLIPPTIIEIFQLIPCHKAFYAFAQWHNLAIRVIDDLGLPSLLLYYENYETDFNATVNEIFQFLQISTIGDISQFIAGKDYMGYFSSSEVEAARKLMEIISDRQTWDIIKRYFE